MFRQTTRDFCVHQQFRKDYWVKGVRTLSKLEQTEALRAQRVILVQPRADVSLKVNGNLGEATMQEGVYNPILDLLADHKAKSLGQIEQALKAAGAPIGLAQFVWTILAAQGQRLVKEGTTLESAEDNLAELTAQAQVFADKQLPILRALMVG